MKWPRIAIGALALALVLTGCTSTPDTSTTPSTTTVTTKRIVLPPAYTAVTVTQLGAPTLPFKGTDGKYHVVYDLLLTNASRASATLEKVQVVDEAHRSTVVASFSGTQLVDPTCEYGNCNRLRTLPSSPAPDTSIPPQQSRALLVGYSFASLKDAPQIVLHRMFLSAASNPGAKDPTEVNYLVAPVNISAGAARVIAPPVKGTNWVAQNGCCDIGFPHIPSLSPLDGKLSNSQRLAIDWMRTNDQGEFYTGDKTKNESYFGYGQTVYAVADGTISSELNELAPNTPGTLPADDPVLAKQITVENVDGNNIVEDIGGGVWAMYAHLQKGSLLVKPGDKVKAGQAIAKLGNTGNSNAAHLHFQLMNEPNLIGADAVPYVINSFSYAGFIAPSAMLNTDSYVSGKYFADHLSTVQKRTDQLPLNGSIVNFSR
ncbi:M23 family metallopeptidase [Rathayibacter soli]|uniref:M23 family metallopeptidase n=1 Tax=Rathayibacter soli TaxID=3144168 RepID=UPI0027E53011|nr:peptidoglycan DD-metalloendopeptidase family protein [Glaciibacter superstes]